MTWSLHGTNRLSYTRATPSAYSIEEVQHCFNDHRHKDAECGREHCTGADCPDEYMERLTVPLATSIEVNMLQRTACCFQAFYHILVHAKVDFYIFDIVSGEYKCILHRACRAMS